MYGVGPSDGLRTTSRFVNPASPSAVESPSPPADSPATSIAVYGVISYAAYRVDTTEVAS